MIYDYTGGEKSNTSGPIRFLRAVRAGAESFPIGKSARSAVQSNFLVRTKVEIDVVAYIPPA